MEANCYPAHTTRARLFLVLTAIMVFMATVQGNTEEVTAAGAPEGGLLCISKCGTCPATCEPPPPPPSPTLTPQTPYTTQSPPPPPSKAHSSPPSPPAHGPPPPPGQGQQGGPSNPYYYFYTSEATCEHPVSGFLRLFPMISFFFLSVLLQ
ncbi:putative branchpoint-bridging protein-like [Cocos nucifera]|nr:putative branchpoint-bridging protein-like [Cocos nucifera]